MNIGIGDTIQIGISADIWETDSKINFELDIKEEDETKAEQVVESFGQALGIDLPPVPDWVNDLVDVFDDLPIGNEQPVPGLPGVTYEIDVDVSVDLGFPFVDVSANSVGLDVNVPVGPGKVTISVDVSTDGDVNYGIKFMKE